MARVLDATVTSTVGTEHLDQALTEWSGPQHPVAAYLAKTEARHVPRLALFGAVGSWFAIVYFLTYILLPTLSWSLGLQQNLVGFWLGNTLAFVPTALAAACLIAVVSPKVVTHLDARRDPVVAATLGGLVVSLAAHETLAILQPLSGMYWPEALAFALSNGVEFGLIGLVLASLTRSPTRAFLLAAAFQIVNVAIFTSLFSF